MTIELDCPGCGKPMLWKYLKKPLCPCCNAEDVEKVYASKTDQLRRLTSGKLPHNAELKGEPLAASPACKAGDFERIVIHRGGMKMNTWPEGKRRAMTQSEHAAWNSNNYPGTLQICCKCSEPTGRCEEDEITDDDGNPHCYDCAIGCGICEGDSAN